ncbi:hypothetical protein [Saccharothrix sp. ST-888]|uniref:hypothetical protein n=1 Tax=Saccharothrix sp. ST-888 TaxID=1427391 RepID=UPI0012E07131|nr:hypothetical protein [Saccharothrix sp. ST-888]
MPEIPAPRRTWAAPSTVPTGGGNSGRSYDGRSAPGLETTWRYDPEDPGSGKCHPCSYQPQPQED